ncbi:MAG: autotransporter-associated beta strand repeat-containing protein [Verrucomicrobiales bacterium]|nr:autotransporter-associated beta strand repeat-containing protein [Verrucomicrobiales bacterium]
MTSWAADLTWDGSVDSDWDTSTANWSGSTWNNATPDNATFDATGVGTIILTEDITAGNITFDLDGYTIDTTNGNLTINNGITANRSATISGANEVKLGGDNTWEVASGRTLTVSSVISGAQSLTKSGAGDLDLSGANTYTGTTTIDGGRLEIVSGSNGTSDFVVNNGALVINSGQTISTTANIHLENGGDFRFNRAMEIGDLSGSGDVIFGRKSNRNLTINNGAATVFSGAFSESNTGALSIIKNGAGSLTLSGTNTHRGTTTVNGGTLILAGGSAILDSGVVTTANTLGARLQLNDNETIGGLTGGGTTGGIVDLQSNTLTIDISDGSTRVFTGNIEGTGGSLTIAGNGIQTLAGTNTYTGTTTVNSGTLQLQLGNAIADTGAVVIADEATATLKLVNIETIGSLSGGGSSGGAVDLGIRTLTVGNTANTTFAGNIIGDDSNASLTKIGTGNLTLSGNNTYTGTTTVSAGTLILAGGNALSDSGTVGMGNVAGAILKLNNDETIGGLTGGGTTGGIVDLQSNALTIAISGTATFSGNIIGSSGTLTMAGSGTQTLAGNNTYTGTTTVNSGILQLQNGNAIVDSGAVVIADVATATLELLDDETIGSLSGGGSNGGTLDLGVSTLTLGNTSNTTFAGNIVGDDANASLTKIGSGNLTLSGNNTYTGTTTVNVGALVLAGGNAIADSGTVVLADAADALLQLDASETIGSLSGGGSVGGNVDLQGNTLTVGTGTYAGTILGTGNLTKSGAGTLNLSGTNTYTGTTTINGGKLALAGSNESSRFVVNSGTLEMNNGPFINTTADIHLESGAEFKFNTPVTMGGLSGSGDVNFTRKASRDLTLNSGGETTVFSGTISETNTGALNVQKNGGGTLTFSGNNTYSGSTIVDAGTLIINSTTGSGTGTGAVIVNNGATLGGTGRIGDATTGGITIQSGGIHTAATVTTAGTQTILGDLTYASGATLTWNLISNSVTSGQFDTFDVSGTLAFNDDGTIADDLFFNISFDNDVNLDDSFWQNGANTNEWKVWNVTGAGSALDGLEYSIGLAGNSNAQGQQYSNASAFDLEARSDGIYLLQTSAVPEPSTFGLMGLGLAAFGWARRSRKRTAVDNG